MFDPLPDDLARAIDVARTELGPFARLFYCAETGSTNDVALRLAGEGAPEGTGVLAGVQRQGRGRRGHEWWSPPGAGLYLSVVIRPPADPGIQPLVTLAAGVAAAESLLATTGLPVELKWPNDLVIGSPWRKLGGILTEGVTTGGALSALVVGIGINLVDRPVPPPLEATATSVEAELGRRCDRPALLTTLLGRLRLAAALVHEGGRGAIIERWRWFARSGLGGDVRWHDAEGEHRGVARDVDDDGALLVSREGVVVRVVAGDVIWEGLSGA